MRTIPMPLLLGAFLLWFSGETAAQRALPAGPERVVFVCEHGSVKSLVAMTYFNQRAQARGLPYSAIARGTAPEPSVPNPVREGLRAAGFDVSHFVPQRLAATDVDGALAVVSFDQDIASTVTDKPRIFHWDNLPGILADYSRGQDAIVKRVDDLLYELEHRGAR
jgi:arsenate reductase (thioredoxin)